MKKFIKQGALFILFALLFYVVALVVWAYLSPVKFNLVLQTHGFTKERMIEAKQKENVDILVLGSSRTYRGFDPRIFASYDKDIFVLGTSNQTHIQTYMLVERYLYKLKPKRVIYEVSADLFANDGIESACDLIYNDEINSLSYSMAYDTGLCNMKIINTLLFSQIRQWLHLPHEASNRKSNGDETYISGGYVAKEIEEYRHVFLEDSISWEIKDKQLLYFEKTIALLKKENIEVQLVQAPLSPSYYSMQSGSRQFDTLMQTYGEYYNFNNIIQLSDSIHFADETHLNQRGVDAFNKALIEKLLLQ